MDTSTSNQQSLPDFGLLQLAVLDHGRIRPSDLAAELYSLADRGFIEVIDRDQNVLFFRIRNIQGLIPYETSLIKCIFPDQDQVAEIGVVISRLTSKEVKQSLETTYQEVYASLVANRVFNEDPRRIRNKLLAVTSLVQSFALLIVIGGAFRLFSSSLALIIIGFVFFFIIQAIKKWVLPGLPHPGAASLPLKQAWNSFNDFLKESSFIGALDTQGRLYYQYLPYAQVLGTVKQWTQRFQNIQGWYIPRWYTTQGQPLYRPEDFVQFVTIIMQRLAEAMVKVADDEHRFKKRFAKFIRAFFVISLLSLVRAYLFTIMLISNKGNQSVVPVCIVCTKIMAYTPSSLVIVPSSDYYTISQANTLSLTVIQTGGLVLTMPSSGVVTARF